MGDKILPTIPLSCIRAGGGWVSAHLGRAKGLAAVVVHLGHNARCHGRNTRREEQDIVMSSGKLCASATMLASASFIVI
ncbi:hypothetical protein Hanom_Chr01g00013771 [Helianthus anomalus]